MDLGDCPKIHDLALRADYELASKDKDFYYDIEVSVKCNRSRRFVIRMKSKATRMGFDLNLF